jgi:ABC-type transport system substrate-binding protein
MVKRTVFRIFCPFLLLLFFLSLSSLGQETNNGPRYGGVFHLKAFANEFRIQLDPASPDSFIFLSEQLFDGLVRLDKNLNIVPHLAEYWVISSDGTRYTFYLRKGVRFHHGSELTAEDVKFSLERLLDPKLHFPYHQYFLNTVVGAKDFWEGKAQEVSGFKVLDKYTFEIQWIKPFVSALSLMSMNFCKILPREFLLDKGKGFFFKPSGTGPFVFDSWLRNTRLDIIGVRLVRNEDYFGGKAYLQGIEFSPLFTLDHFLDGEIESIPVLSEKILRFNYQIFENGLLHPVFLGMSCHIPPFNQATVRRAIAFAINKEEIARAASGVSYALQVTNNYIPPRLPGFFPKDDETSFDLEQAKMLLQEAGFSPENRLPIVTLFLDSPRTESKLRTYKEFRSQLEALGIRLRLSFYKSSEEIIGFKEPYLVLSERVMTFPDPEAFIRPLFYSNSEFNIFRYSNPEVDALLQEAEVEPSWTKRIGLFHQIEQILASDVPAIPLFFKQNRVAMQPYVRGVEVPPLGFYYLDATKIWLDR